MAKTTLVKDLNESISYLQLLIENQKLRPYFYFKVKLMINKNNSHQLVDKVLGIGKQHMYIFWADQQQNSKYPAFTNSKKQATDLQKIQFPQQKIALSKFDQFVLISSDDPQYVQYLTLKSIRPNLSSEQAQQLQKNKTSLVFLKSLQQFQTQCIICPTYSKGMQLLYILQLMQTLRSYEQLCRKDQQNLGKSNLILHKTNLKLMRMICNIKFGMADISTQNFGYNCKGNYNEDEQRQQMRIYQNLTKQIFQKESSYQFIANFSVNMVFKIIDDQSIKYGVKFIQPLINKVETLKFDSCQITEESFQSMFKSLIEGFQQKIGNSPFHSMNQYLFQNLQSLDLSENKLTDNIIHSFNRLIQIQSQRRGKKSSSNFVLQTAFFRQLKQLNLSKNYISLNSKQIQKTFVKVLENLSAYTLQIDLSINAIKSLEFFEKYFTNAETKAGTITLPVEYFNLTNNRTITDDKKQAFINDYIEKNKQLDEKFMTQLSFIIEFGQIKNNRSSHILGYLQLLKDYYDQNQNCNSSLNNFSGHFDQLCSCNQLLKQEKNKIDSKNNDKISVSLSKPVSNLQKSQSRVSLVSPTSSAMNLSKVGNAAPSAIQTQNLLQTLTKLFYLKDYKQIQLYKKQLKQKHKLTDNILQSTLKIQIDQKRQQQKRIIRLMEEVSNFIDPKGQYCLKTESDQKKINQKLETLTGIIRRKGLQGKVSQFIVYLKYLRDNNLTKWLSKKEQFDQINPIYKYMNWIVSSYSTFYRSLLLQDRTFLEVDYKELSQISTVNLKQRFFKNKQQPSSSFNQSDYDRYKYLLLEEKLIQKKILPLTQTLLKQLKLFPTKVVRNHTKWNTQNKQQLSIIKTTQKLTSRQFNQVGNKIEFIRKYSILHYPFNSNITGSTQLSGYQGAMSCLIFQQSRSEQALSFIQIVNNLVTFLFYTPEAVSEQTVTYLNYIITFLNQFTLESIDDVQFKQFLIQEMYLHLMTYKPQQKLANGIILHILEYLTSRLICRPQLQNYILAYILQNQSSNIEGSHLVFNSLIISNQQSQKQPSQQSLKKQQKISWTIPNNFLLNSFLNKGKLTLNIRLDTSSILQPEQVIQVCIHQTLTIADLFKYFTDKSNGLIHHLILQRRSKGIQQILDRQLQNYWFFQKIQKEGKIQYYRPYQSYRYIGEIVSQSFQTSQIIVFYLRKCVIGQFHLDKRNIAYQLDENSLFGLFNKVLSNLAMSIEFISKLDLKRISPVLYSLLTDNQSNKISNSFDSNNKIGSQFIIVVFSNIISVLYSKLLQSYSKSIKSTQFQSVQSFEDKKQQLFHQLIQKVLYGKSSLLGQQKQKQTQTQKQTQKVIINFKTFNVQQKLSIISRSKQLIHQSNIQCHQKKKNNQSIGQSIINLINILGDLGYCQSIVSKDRIIIVNSRFIAIGSLLEHRNQLNEIVNVYSKVEFFAFFNQLVDCRIQRVLEQNKQNKQKCEKIMFTLQKVQLNNQQNSELNKQKIQLNHQQKKPIQIFQFEIKGDPYFVISLFNLFNQVCKNILHFDNQLLYDLQKTGLGISTQKRTSQNFQLYQNQVTQSNPNKGIYFIPQNLIQFSKIRNKQNQTYKRKQVTSKLQTVNKQSRTSLINNEKQPQQVYSRKSSKRSIRSNRSQNAISSKVQENQSLSLIPSRKSLYDRNSPKEQNQKIINQNNQIKHQQSRLSSSFVEIKTEQIIKNANQRQLNDRQVQNNAKSENIVKTGQVQNQIIVTNQQRKSRKQMPKRRSSRQKDR